MARANLNKSKKVLTSTTTASKYIPKRPRICINWNTAFKIQIYLVNCKSTSKCKHCETTLKKTVFENFMKWGLKGGSQLIQTRGSLGYVLWCCSSSSQDFFTFIQIGSGHTVGSALSMLLSLQHIALQEERNQLSANSCLFLSRYCNLGPERTSKGRRNVKKCWWGQAFVLDKICPPPRPPPDLNRVD